MRLDDAAATGSSLMPQKRNPDPFELVRAARRRAIGSLAGAQADRRRPRAFVPPRPAGDQAHRRPRNRTSRLPPSTRSSGASGYVRWDRAAIEGAAEPSTPSRPTWPTRSSRAASRRGARTNWSAPPSRRRDARPPARRAISRARAERRLASSTRRSIAARSIAAKRTAGSTRRSACARALARSTRADRD